MGKLEDLSGKRFGSLTVIEFGGKYQPSGNVYWRCIDQRKLWQMLNRNDWDMAEAIKKGVS